MSRERTGENLEEKSERKIGSWEMLRAVCWQCRVRSESERGTSGEGTKAGKRTKDESGCRWRGRKESHEMLGRFVGPAGEPRGRDAVEAGTVDKARAVGRRTAGV